MEDLNRRAEKEKKDDDLWDFLDDPEYPEWQRENNGQNIAQQSFGPMDQSNVESPLLDPELTSGEAEVQKTRRDMLKNPCATLVEVSSSFRQLQSLRLLRNVADRCTLWN